MKTKFKIIGISVCFLVLTSIIYANYYSSYPIIGDEAYVIDLEYCTGCEGCLGSGITDMVEFDNNRYVAIWTSVYTRMVNNELDFLLKTAPSYEKSMANEAYASCPFDNIYKL